LRARRLRLEDKKMKKKEEEEEKREEEEEDPSLLLSSFKVFISPPRNPSKPHDLTPKLQLLFFSLHCSITTFKI